MPHPVRRTLATALIGSLAVAGLAVSSNAPASAATPPVTIAIPAYFNDDALWDRAVNTPEVTYVIGHPIAPEAGKSYKADADLAARLTKAKSKGKTVLVYVTGGYDKIDWTVVADRIDTVLGAYPMADGVFIDEINYDECAKYSALTKGTSATKGVRGRQAGKLIVLNPGAPILNCYDGLADGYVNLERAEKDIPAWTDNVNLAGNVPFYSWMFTPASRPKMWQMVHTVPASGAAAAVDAAVSRNASVVYLTDDVMPNPYDTVPSGAFFQAMVDRVSQYATGKVALPAVKQLTAPVAQQSSSAATATSKPATTKKPVVTKRRATTRKR